MKKFTILFATTALLISSCKSEVATDTSNESSNSVEIEEPQVIIANYELDADNSTILWDRILDQKSSKKKTKMFGAEVELDLGPIKLNMNGNANPTKGNLETADDLLVEGDMLFDMTTFKFAQERGQGLFDTQNHPTSELKFTEIKPTADESIYDAVGVLTIQEHTESIPLQLTLNLEGNSAKISSSFKFNTLDFPLREPAEIRVVNKDEITVKLDLTYKKVE